MKKKTYISPSIRVNRVEPLNIVCASVTSFRGNTGLDYYGDETESTSADSRGFSLWDDDED